MIKNASFQKNTDDMKKFLLVAITSLLTTLSAGAQEVWTGRQFRSFHGDVPVYYGIRIGAAFSHVNSDDKMLDGGSLKAGLNIGGLVGVQITRNAPVYFEAGLSYIQKGGIGYVYSENGNSRSKFKYNLDYIELPFCFKYKYDFNYHMSLQPFLGGYFALGVGGKIRDFGERKAYGSFSDDEYSFRRFDGGLRFGCGFNYDLFYVEIGYEFGLANICHDAFDTSHNGCLQLNVGMNF